MLTKENYLKKKEEVKNLSKMCRLLKRSLKYYSRRKYDDQVKLLRYNLRAKREKLNLLLETRRYMKELYKLGK